MHAALRECLPSPAHHEVDAVDGEGRLGRPVIRGNLHNVDKVPTQRGNSGRRLWSGTSNLVTVVYDLYDAAPEDGGFGCLPRSHVQGYEMPISRDPDP